MNGEARLDSVAYLDKPVIIVENVTNSVIYSMLPDSKMYRVGVLRVEGMGMFSWYDDVAVVVDNNNHVSAIGSDEEAIAFINSQKKSDEYEMSEALKDINMFAELRNYHLATEETLQKLKEALRLWNPERVSKWTVVIKNGLKKNGFQVTFVTHLGKEVEVIWCERYFFEFNPHGQMKFIKKEDAGSIGGYQ